MLSRRDLLRGACATGAWLAAGGWSGAREPAAAGDSLVGFVDPFIGTGGHGHTFPGAAVPSGMVQLSPDSGKQGWDWCAGYHASDTELAGFTHTHLSGTSAGDLCDILVVPVQAGEDMPEDPRSLFSHDREKASAGYYSVDLLAHDIRAELTATRRAGIHRYSFLGPAAGRAPGVLVDLGFAINMDRPTETQIAIDGPATISGYRFSTGWAKDQRVYFVATFSRPIRTWLLGGEGSYSADRREARGRKVKGLFRFLLRPGEPLLVKVALSPVSVEGARKNMEAEGESREFDGYRRDAEEAWERKLARVRIETPDRARKTVFYTAMYHALLAPALFCDVDRRYRGPDGQIHTSDTFQNHTVFSLWDTFRALHPLLTIIQPERVDYLVQSMMAFARESGLLPVWPLWGNETDATIGYHAVPVILDAIQKGLTRVGLGEVLDVMKRSALQDAHGLMWLKGDKTPGYIPADQEKGAVSKLLEYAYDDWCLAQLAGKLERASDRRQFEARAAFYRNVFDPSVGFMRGRLAGGGWRAPFSPTSSGVGQDDFTEGNAWQYTWFVPHDVQGLIDLIGGRTAFVKKLDAFFEQSPDVEGTSASPDTSGMIGQYAHGHEPSHHVAYLYAYAGAPWKTAARVRQIMTALYGTGPEGLCSHENCGQLSAWYILSALGFYPVNPAEGVYVLGTPNVERAEIDVGGGHTFTIEAQGLSDANLYVQGVTLNGRPLDRCWFRHEDLASGGSLRFTMGPEPNTAWASGPEAAPPAGHAFGP
ncbi:MAG: GH92 family glycosyl hydrolase [Acidobacteriota bacterium]